MRLLLGRILLDALASGKLSTYAGDGKRGLEDGDFAAARFNEPNDLLRIGEKLYVANTNNHRIRVLDPLSRQVTTLALKGFGPEPTPVDTRPMEKLPNLKIRQELSLASGRKILWKLELPAGWKVNADAPSRLQLFDLSTPAPKLLAAFSKESVADKQVYFPSLQAGGSYLLQGLLYYCREGAESLCYVGSAEAKIQASVSGESSLTWQITP